MGGRWGEWVRTPSPHMSLFFLSSLCFRFCQQRRERNIAKGRKPAPPGPLVFDNALLAWGEGSTRQAAYPAYLFICRAEIWSTHRQASTFVPPNHLPPVYGHVFAWAGEISKLGAVLGPYRLWRRIRLPQVAEESPESPHLFLCRKINSHSFISRCVFFFRRSISVKW